MKNILFASALLLLISGNALAGMEYDKCIKEEKALKKQEAHDCSGLSYLLNPNACFATQKAMKEYLAGKCKKIGITENVDFSVQKTLTDKKGNNVSNAARVSPINNSNNSAMEKVGSDVQPQETACDQLQRENTRLKAEIKRLVEENDQLKKTKL